MSAVCRVQVHESNKDVVTVEAVLLSIFTDSTLVMWAHSLGFGQ